MCKKSITYEGNEFEIHFGLYDQGMMFKAQVFHDGKELKNYDMTYLEAVRSNMVDDRFVLENMLTTIKSDLKTGAICA
jgi:hypothetical protein